MNAFDDAMTRLAAALDRLEAAAGDGARPLPRAVASPDVAADLETDTGTDPGEARALAEEIRRLEAENARLATALKSLEARHARLSERSARAAARIDTTIARVDDLFAR